MTQDTPRVYGARTCHQCKDICHKGSLRIKYRKRKTYFCGEKCLRYYETQKLRERLRQMECRAWREAEWDEELWQRHLENFEPVDVITP